MYVMVPKVGGVKSFNFAGKHQVEYSNHYLSENTLCNFCVLTFWA